MSWRKFPIKFYQLQDETVHYENKFMNGNAPTIEQAFSELAKIDFNWDLMYYYEDVTSVKLGSFKPALVDKKYKGMLYLGEIELSLNIDTGWGQGEHSVTHLSKHPEDIPKQDEFIKKLKREAKRDEFIKSIKIGLKKLVNKIRPNTFYLEHIEELLEKANEDI